MSNKLCMLRREYGISGIDLFNAVGLDRSTVSKIEQGKREIPLGYVKALCDYFKVTSDYLLGYSDFGIICMCDGKEVIISESEYSKFSEYIYFTKSTGRVLSKSGFVEISMERQSNNTQRVTSIMLSYTNELDIDIIKKLSKLDDSQKKAILQLIDTFVK